MTQIELDTVAAIIRLAALVDDLVTQQKLANKLLCLQFQLLAPQANRLDLLVELDAIKKEIDQ